MPYTQLEKAARARAMAASGEARKLRLAAHVTLAELADEVGVTLMAIYFWETQQRCPSGDNAVRYFQALTKLQQLIKLRPVVVEAAVA